MRSTARFTAEIDDEDQEAGTGVATYDWDWGDGTTHGTQKSPKHTYTKSGSYQWKVTVSIRYLEQYGVAHRVRAHRRHSGRHQAPADQAVARQQEGQDRDDQAPVADQRRPVLLSLKAGRYAIKPREVTLKAQKDMSFTLSTRALRNARAASFGVRFLAVPAGPVPDARSSPASACAEPRDGRRGGA